MFVALCLSQVSCTTDSVVDNYKTKEPTSITITYSTGGAKWDAVNPETLELNKLGVGSTGSVPYLIVTSNNYWTVRVPEEYAEWLQVSPKGGPQPASETTNVYLTLTNNKDVNERTAEVIFTTYQGEEFIVPIKQHGDTSTTLFVLDTFGDDESRLKEDMAVKFYNYTNADKSSTFDGVAVAGDQYPYGYVGSDNVYVSLAEPSHGYSDVVDGTPASGGANILINPDGEFTARNFNNQNKVSFHLTFGAKNCDGRFNPADLKLLISHDNNPNDELWSEMPYRHDVSEVNDWTINSFDFQIAPNVTKVLYFKFKNVSSDVYRIDDFKITEKVPADDNDMLYELISIGSDIVGLPANFLFNNLSTTKRNGEYWISYGTVFSEESGFYEDGASDQINSWEHAHVQFVCGSDVSLVKRRNGNDGMVVTSSSPKVTGQYKDDYWIWTIPVYKASAMTNMRCEFTFMGTDAGVKYHFFESAQCSYEDYPFADKNILTMTDEEKRAFYDTLDWTVYDEKTISVADEPYAKNGGIPIGEGGATSYSYEDITYSCAGENKHNQGNTQNFAGGSGSYQRVIDKIVTFPEAMVQGYYFIRLRAASNLTCGQTNSTSYQRINRVDHNGTNYLRNTAKFSFSKVSPEAAYSDAFKLLAINNNVDQFANYEGGAVTFSSSAKIGVFAGDELNLLATTAANNIFTGRCETDQSGKDLYVYSPYDASSLSAEDVSLAVPTEQYISAGSLVANSAAFVLSNYPKFKTTSTMRCNMDLVSSLLQLNIYSSKAMADKISTVELTANTNIAGSYHYDLMTRARGEENMLSKSLTARSLAPISVGTESYNTEPVYLGIWDGSHTLTVKVTAGGFSYTKTFTEASEFVEGKVTKLDINLAELDPEAVGDVPQGITSADMFKQFIADVNAGKTGDEMTKYRNIDGVYAFGADIDMAGITIDSTWPLVTLNEDFNGGNYRIKNLTISTPNTALFRNVAYGCTFENVVIDESCKIYADGMGNTKELRYSFLFIGGDINFASQSSHIPVGNIKNVVSYGSVEVTGDIAYYCYVAPIIAYASGAKQGADASEITGCVNYGDIYIHDVTQSRMGSGPYHYYAVIGGIIGKCAGVNVHDCTNNGKVVFSNVRRIVGSMDVGGIAGYGANLFDANTGGDIGMIHDCTNYGDFYFGYDLSGTPTSYKALATRVGGLVGRTQWSSLERMVNHGNFHFNAECSDPFQGGVDEGVDGITYPATWSAHVTATTNTVVGFHVGGVLGFAQNNLAIGIQNNLLENYGTFEGSVTMAGSIRPADNVGIAIGGVMGCMGANAHNAHFTNCSNLANITIKSNAASADIYLGGVMGRMASTRYSDSSFYKIEGCANVGAITFNSDAPESVAAHVGGVAGSMLYSVMRSNINGGAVVNNSTHPDASTGSILGLQRKSNIGTNSGSTKGLLLESNAAGGSVNGVVLTNENYMQYIYGRYEEIEPELKDNSLFTM